MDPTTLFRIAPTFPLNEELVQVRRRIEIASSPITWGSLLGASLMGLAFGAGVLGFVSLYGVTAFALSRYWSRRRAWLEAAVLRGLVRESNLAQDVDLARIVRRLNEKHYPQYALVLDRFLALKKSVESELHHESSLGIAAAEIEELVDGVCAEICREITFLIAREDELGAVLTSGDEKGLAALDSLRAGSHASILHAYKTLHHTAKELAGRAEVVRGAGAESFAGATTEPGLSGLVRDLREEADLITRTKVRLSAAGVETGRTTSPSAEAVLSG